MEKARCAREEKLCWRRMERQQLEMTRRGGRGRGREGEGGPIMRSRMQEAGEGRQEDQDDLMGSERARSERRHQRRLRRRGR